MYRQEAFIMARPRIRMQDVAESADHTLARGELSRVDTGTSCSGLLIINADDWGRDRDTTERIRECRAKGTVSSVSAMVFMEDSERAAAIGREIGIDAGLHLNFSTLFTSPSCPSRLRESQGKVAAYLLRHPFARILFHPGLVREFQYIVSSQLEEFRRVYGEEPHRLDGHHHLHLCANVLLGGLLPVGTVVRRNFTFHSGEKSLANRFYRQSMDRLVGLNHRLVDFMFSLAPLEPVDRLHRIISMSRRHIVEVETHPVNPKEHRFLIGSKIFDLLHGVPIAHDFSLPLCDTATKPASRTMQGRA